MPTFTFDQELGLVCWYYPATGVWEFCTWPMARDRALEIGRAIQEHYSELSKTFITAFMYGEGRRYEVLRS